MSATSNGADEVVVRERRGGCRRVAAWLGLASDGARLVPGISVDVECGDVFQASRPFARGRHKRRRRNSNGRTPDPAGRGWDLVASEGF